MTGIEEELRRMALDRWRPSVFDGNWERPV